MSEFGVGVVERELIDRARDAEIARRRDYYVRLELIAELDRRAVAAATGDRGTVRLLQSHWRLDHTEAKRLVDEAADLVARHSLQGEPLPPRLPVTAAVAAHGEIGAAHIAVIRRTMARLERIDSLSVADWVEADRFLADEARSPPQALAQVAKALIATLDPDGEAPTEGEDRCDGRVQPGNAHPRSRSCRARSRHMFSRHVSPPSSQLRTGGPGSPRPTGPTPTEDPVSADEHG